MENPFDRFMLPPKTEPVLYPDIAGRPVLLDLFCKAGGAGMGYYEAGFNVVGVDIDPQPHYPFRFIQADALTVDISGYDAYHASPPCQAYTAGNELARGRGIHIEHPDLVPSIRERLRATGKPYVIENVPGAPLIDPVQLCGSYFNLLVIRHRLFESNMLLCGVPCRHKGIVMKKNEGNDGYYWRVYGHERGCQHWPAAMGIIWPMSREELANAIPPAYTEWIGRQIMRQI